MLLLLPEVWVSVVLLDVTNFKLTMVLNLWLLTALLTEKETGLLLMVVMVKYSKVN